MQGIKNSYLKTIHGPSVSIKRTRLFFDNNKEIMNINFDGKLFHDLLLTCHCDEKRSDLISRWNEKII